MLVSIGDKMKVFKRATAFILLLTIALTTLTACNTPTKRESVKVVDTEYKYSEADLVAEMKAEKSSNVKFADNGNLLFDYVVYPAEIDSIEMDKKDSKKPAHKERFKVELKNSAVFMAKTLSEMTGDTISAIPNTNANANGKAIKLVVDDSVKNDTKGQGHIINIANEEIAITSDSYQGVSNGVMSFLEDKLGCMFVAVDYDYVPKLKDINLAVERYTNVPDIMWREVYAYETEKRITEGKGVDYLAWNSKLRLNGSGFDDNFNWCHTSFPYLDPKEYFNEHPEYYSLYNGVRVIEQGPVSGQICWTNEDVYQIISNKIWQEMEENPDMHIWDVSQMDTWINRGVGCQCENCKAIDDEEESQMGSILYFINRLADECAVKYPDNYISTLSYNYSVKPPKNMVPRENVIIKLCLMPGDNASSLKDPYSKEAMDSKQIVEEWGKKGAKLLIWDYNVNFHNYLMPHPALYAMQDNHEFYVENNTYGIFHQMDWDKGGADAELTAYLFAKSMWDKDLNVEKLASKYMDVYYGKSADSMKEYYNELTNDVITSGKVMYIYDTPTTVASKYFSSKNLDKYFEIFDKALTEAGDDEVLKARINKAKIGVLYTKASAFSLDIKDRKDALNEWYKLCRDNGIVAVKEGEEFGLERYYNDTMTIINATPWIIASSVVILIGLIVGATFLGLFIKKKIRDKSIDEAVNKRDEIK